jgi:hypothetical protein
MGEMDFRRSRIEFDDALVELLDWIREELTVYVVYSAEASGASFTARFVGADPVMKDDPALLLKFERDCAFAHLDPASMTAYRIFNTLTENHWLEFEILGRHALMIDASRAPTSGDGLNPTPPEAETDGF